LPRGIAFDEGLALAYSPAPTRSSVPSRFRALRASPQLYALRYGYGAVVAASAAWLTP